MAACVEPLSGYLVLVQALYEKGMHYASPWNFGPRDEDARSVAEVIDLLIKRWGGAASWEREGAEQPHEASLLKLDCSKARQYLAWAPRWTLETAIEKIVDWQNNSREMKDMQAFTLAQINEYMNT